jgi:hypothetical protein
VAAHVYENPGTYTIQLTVHDRLGYPAISTTQVEVTPFSGTTYYVATDGSNTAAGTSTTSPLATPDYAISNKGGPNTRILLRNGDRFTVPPITVSNTGPMIVGSYSDPNRPSSVLPMLYCTTDGWGIVNVSGASDCRFMDIHIRSSFDSIGNGNASPNQRAAVVNANAMNTLFLRVEIDSVGRDAIDGGGLYTFLFDCLYHDYGWYGCFVDSLNHLAMVGIVSRRLKGNQHFFRSQGGSKAFIAYNDIDESNANYDNITCRGSTSQAYVLGNQFDLNMGFHPQYSGAIEYQSYCVADGNLFRSGGIGVAAKHVSVRNNLFHNGSISLLTYPTVGMSEDVTIFDNSCYSESDADLVSGGATNTVVKNNLFYTDTTINYASGISLSGALTNYQVDNNIYWGPRLTRPFSFGTGGFSGWQGQGFDVHGKVADPQFVSTDASTPDFLKLRATSPARGAGAIVPVFDDIAGVARPLDQPADAGAWLYGSSSVRPSLSCAKQHAGLGMSGSCAFDLRGRLISTQKLRLTHGTFGLIVLRPATSSSRMGGLSEVVVPGR